MPLQVKLKFLYKYNCCNLLTKPKNKPFVLEKHKYNYYADFYILII